MSLYFLEQLNISSSLVPGDSLVLDVISDASEDILVGQTLKRPLLVQQLLEDQKSSRQNVEQDRFQQFVPKDPLDQSNFLSLYMHMVVNLLIIFL